MISSNKLTSNFKNYLFIAPAVAVFSVFYIFPFFYIFKLSFFDWDGISPAMVFVGLQNFLELLRDGVWW
ncbi:MAG: sugar ABC transporter permease, partial [Candidatus Omnitrophica bacterium]|nr:sugar ABC transporter permease [Candidatus Omnitrophota bacterium]